MIAERHNAPQHNLHANRAGKAGDCTSGAHAGLPWRRVGRFFATTVSASFILNEIWEMAQMSAYVETAGQPWTSTLGLCTRAAMGDVGIILGIYMAVGLAAGDPGWGLRGRWNSYVTAALLGLVYAVLVEHAALATGRWSYTDRVPVVPLLRAGLWPLLQMTLLPPLTFLFARWRTGRGERRSLIKNHTKGGPTMNHMGEWMGGWTGGGMWVLTAVGILVAVLLVVVIMKMSKR